MRCFEWLVTLLHISSKTTDDIVKKNDQVILSGIEVETIWVIGTHDNNYNKKSWLDQLKKFLIMLNWSIPKKWNLSIENLHTGIQFSYRLYRQHGRVVKAMDVRSIGLCMRGFGSHLCRFFNWFYGEMDSNFQFEILIRVQISEKKLVTWNPQPPRYLKI